MNNVISKALVFTGITMAAVGIALGIMGFVNFLMLRGLVMVGFLLVFLCFGIIPLGLRHNVMKKELTQATRIVSEAKEEPEEKRSVRTAALIMLSATYIA